MDVDRRAHAPARRVVLFELPLLDTDEVMARIDAVTLDDLRALTDELWAPGALSRPASAPTRTRSAARRGRRHHRGMIRVAVAGAAGRMGQTTVSAIESAPDLELAGRADPALGVAVAEGVDGADVLVDFSLGPHVVPNAKLATAAGVHVVIGATGWDEAELREAVSGANVFAAPNFAIGAVLMMRFAAEASKLMSGAEIIEYHHPAKLDAPSGTAARTAALMDGEVPIHSVRLPGIVADQDVILGDTAQTLTIRHVTTDRTSFMPGVLLAVRRVPELPESPLIGLEKLLWPSSP
jgi:4-hydroxy-tetrahydrodipicolinate reductase